MSEWWKNFAEMFCLVVVVFGAMVGIVVAVIKLVLAFGPLVGAVVALGVVATVLGVCSANDQARGIPRR